MMRRVSGVWFVAAALLAGPFLAAPRAQRNQPIYPAYDGYLRNPDGRHSKSMTL